MSRIGKKPVAIPSGIAVAMNGTQVETTGPKGKLAIKLPAGISVQQVGSELVIGRVDDTKKAFHGLVRSLLQNMIIGVQTGYSKELDIQGVGFRAAISGRKLSLSLGFASPIEYAVPETVQVTVTNNTAVVVTGADKQQVGEVAARIRAFYPAEPYKGKGVRYKNEKVRRKVGKTVS